MDKFISRSELKENLRKIENLGKNLSRELQLLHQNVRYILSQIKSCDTQEDAKEYFDILDDIQQTLSILSNKEKIGISSKLERFMYDFDRLDDKQHREYYFNILKQGKYTF